eukprot:3823679-Alexandrium_andersonii.AAC.1
MPLAATVLARAASATPDIDFAGDTNFPLDEPSESCPLPLLPPALPPLAVVRFATSAQKPV